MDCSFLDDDKYKDVMLLRMVDNNNGLPFFMRRYSPQPDADSSALHRHEYMQINYVMRGKGKHQLNGHEFDIVKGDIFVIPPFVPHRIISIACNDMEIFEFEFLTGFINQSFDLMENTESFMDFAYIEPFLVSENQVKPRMNLTGKTMLEVESILDEAMQEYEGRNAGFMLLVKSLLLKLLVLVGREFTKKLKDSEAFSMFHRHKDAIMGAIQYINDNYSEDLNADELAVRFMLSPSYFRYLFKNITAQTFTQYLTGIRISKALDLLGTTDKRVLDICFETGFGNVHHFNKIFRQQTGVTPLEYRKSSRLRKIGDEEDRIRKEILNRPLYNLNR